MTKITNAHPTSWKGLQEEVARILRECDFRVEEPRTLDTVRGTVEIDVFAEEIVHGRKHMILCECKHWKSGVPKNTIHAFRTVVSDIGANVGYIIASKGFQSGASPAAAMTNLKLVTWDEFQAVFEETWLRTHWRKQTDDLWRLMVYFADEDCGEDYIAVVADADKDELRALFEKYFAFGWFINGQWSTRSDSEPVKGHDLPLSALPPLFVPEELPAEILNAECYRSFLLAERTFALAGIRRLRDILARNDHVVARHLRLLLAELDS